MLACSSMLQREIGQNRRQWSVMATGQHVGGFVFFMHFRPFEINLQFFFCEIFISQIFCDNIIHFEITSSGSQKLHCKKLQIDSKWSETSKKHKTADTSPTAAFNHYFCLKQVNTSYHIKFDQSLLIHMACIHKRVLVP